MKRFIVLATVLGLVVAVALPAVALKAPATMTLEISGQGSVVFDHAAHEGFVSDCKACHHLGVGNGQCNGCHGKTPVAPALADAYAANCAKCHTPADTPAANPGKGNGKSKK